MIKNLTIISISSLLGRLAYGDSNNKIPLPTHLERGYLRLYISQDGKRDLEEIIKKEAGSRAPFFIGNLGDKSVSHYSLLERQMPKAVRMTKILERYFWEAQLPRGGFATPARSSMEGKQYLVIACGGGHLDMESGDYYVAFCTQ